MDELSDIEKAAALDDLMRSFREEYWDIEDGYLTIDGSGDIGQETTRVLRIMRDAVLSR